MEKRIKEGKEVKLKRALSLWQVTLCGVGIILGAGIYVLVGKAAGLAGNAVWLSFFLAALVAALTGLSYAELSSMFPRAAGEYLYARNAFGKRIAFLVGWLIIVGQVIASAAVALGFAGYFSSMFFGDTGQLIVPIAAIAIALCGMLLFKGIKESAAVGILFTLIEAAGLIAIIFIGLPYIGSVNYFEITTANIGGIFAAAALIFFAFIGFDELVQLAEETKNAERTIPKALILSIIITTIIYILVAIAVVSVLGWEALGASDAPLADVAAKVFGVEAFLVLGFIALFSTANTVLLVMLSTSRIIYGMAQNNALPQRLARIHAKTRTPHLAILLITIVTIMFALIGNISIVANLTNYAVFIIFIIVNASAIALRYIEKEGVSRAFKMPLNIGRLPVLSVLGILSCIVLLLNVGLEVLVYGTSFLLLGLIVFEVFVKRIQRNKNAS